MTELHQNSPALTALIDELLASNEVGAFRFRVRGFSMEPTLRGGDTVRVVPLDRQPRVGDIVAFPRGSELILHRVVRVTKGAASGRGHVITAGDGLGYLDEAIAIDDILGRVGAVDGSGGTWSPDDPGRWLVGVLRAWLATRPRARRAAHSIRHGLRRTFRRLSNSGAWVE